MYQAQITATATGAPIAEASHANYIATLLGGVGTAEQVDAEQGIWLIDLNDYNETRLEQDGYLGVSVKGYTVEIEMP